MAHILRRILLSSMTEISAPSHTDLQVSRTLVAGKTMAVGVCWALGVCAITQPVEGARS